MYATSPGSITATQINNAIAGAQVGGIACSIANPCVVLLPSGSISCDGITHQSSGVVLRGEGADQTLITITGDADTSCFIGSIEAGIAMCTGNNSRNSMTWSAGYTQGTTDITLSSTTNVTVGQPIFLTQLDDSPGSDWPASGDLHICNNGATTCSALGGGAVNFNIEGADPYPYSSYSAYEVTAKTSSVVSLDHGLILPNYRTGRTNTAWAYASNVFLQWAGIEDLSLDYSALGSNSHGIKCVYCFNVWERGVRSIAPDAPANRPHHFGPYWTYRITIKDNYFFGPEGETGAIDQYAESEYYSFGMLMENNILQQRQSGLVTNAPMSGSVFSYNFTPGRPDPGVVLHAAGEMMNLYEGNVMLGFYADIDHGTHAFETVFRNAMIGHKYSGAAVGSRQAPIHIETKSRFFNVVGNVMGDNSYADTYETELANDDNAIYCLGWSGDASGADPGDDTNVKRTLFRWGNWDCVTSSNDTDTNDTTGIKWDESEVPSGITNFPNPVPGGSPADHTLPASFYLSSRPEWFRDLPWPPIGPDVTNGTITNMGGHAYLNPAADCYLNVMSGATDGSGGPYTFNATTCYAPTGSPGLPAGSPGGSPGLGGSPGGGPPPESVGIKLVMGYRARR